MAKTHFRRWLQFRLAALFWLVVVASLVSLWYVHRQRRIERNARLDQVAAQAKRLRINSTYGGEISSSRPKFDREELATRWLLEIAGRKGSVNEKEEALQVSAAQLRRMDRKVQALRHSGSRGGEEHEVAFVKARQAQVQVAFAQLHANISETRDAMADYVHCLRGYRDELAKVDLPDRYCEILAEIDLAAARVVQAELNCDPQLQIAALREQLVAVQELARVFSNNERNVLAVIAADYAAANIQARLACNLQDGAGEIAAWQEALAHLQKLRAAADKFYDGQPYSHKGAGNEIDLAVRLPRPNLLIDFQRRDSLNPQAESLKLAVLAELAGTCREFAWQYWPPDEEQPEGVAAQEKRGELNFDRYWDGLHALAEFQLEEAGGSPAE
jgi:hypothetical protein